MTDQTLSGYHQVAERFLKNNPGLSNFYITIYETVESSGLNNVPDNYVAGYVRGQNHLIVFADQITKDLSEFQKILRHEAFGHFAIDCLPDKERHQLFDDVARTLISDKDFHEKYLEKVAKEYGGDVTPNNIEEYFSIMAERKVELSFSDKVIGQVRELVRNALRHIGKSIDFNESDTKYFLGSFIERVGNGEIHPFSQNISAKEINQQLKPDPQDFVERVRIWKDRVNHSSNQVSASTSSGVKPV